MFWFCLVSFVFSVLCGVIAAMIVAKPAYFISDDTMRAASDEYIAKEAILVDADAEGEQLDRDSEGDVRIGNAKQRECSAGTVSCHHSLHLFIIVTGQWRTAVVHIIQIIPVSEF